jgi:hypothetical protein
VSDQVGWVVDRLESDGRSVLISEEGEERVVPSDSLPHGVREGDALREAHSEDGLHYLADPGATAELRKKALGLRGSLRKGRPGPISL